MKILYIVPYVPNPVRVRPYEILRTLVRRGHQVTLATLWTNAQERNDLRVLADSGINIVTRPLSMGRSLWNCLSVLPSQTPLQSVYSWHPAFAQQVKRVLQAIKFDIVHVEHLRGATYGLALKRVISRQHGPVPLVWDSVDCISHLFAQAARSSPSTTSRLLTQLELPRTRRHEGRLVHHFDRILVTSQADRQALYELGLQATPPIPCKGQVVPSSDLADRLTVLPNGVNLDYFCPQKSEFFSPEDERWPTTIVFSGKMSYHANVTAALHLVRDIMPHVWRQRPDVHVQIVGKDPPPIIRALDTRDIECKGEQRNQQGCITVTGTVPEVLPYLRQATLAVAPVLYGAGIQNKVLEAMACSTPVVASPQAASGTAARPDHDLLVADDPQRFATQILYLLQDSQRRQQLSVAGRAYVERHHSWQGIVGKLEQIYQTAINCASKTVADSH